MERDQGGTLACHFGGLGVFLGTAILGVEVKPKGPILVPMFKQTLVGSPVSNFEGILQRSHQRGDGKCEESACPQLGRRKQQLVHLPVFNCSVPRTKKGPRRISRAGRADELGSQTDPRWPFWT